MKKILLLTVGIIFYFQAFSQSQNNYSYSVGIKAASFGDFPKLMNEVRSAESFTPSYLNGIVFKFNDNQISYRFIGSKYTNNDYSFKNVCQDCETVNGNFSDFTLKAGFERSLIYGVFQPFYGLDLGYRRIYFDGIANNVSNNALLYDVIVEKNGALIHPLIGVKVNLLKSKFTISAEAGLDILYSNDRETKTLNDGNRTTSIANFRRWGFNNLPLSMLSLQYNFGHQ
ncbi:hypothetical protein [Pedobacter glucosidilyticus]|uniref:hypothetical protein n=1 Tax=Pedobacter glucosidilyticus TaxID=1122941 RepID=UPI0012DE9FE1|nr:hypothetical protein [Pedobacter glucosidilyticus]